jgi:hypothetical protein
MALIKNREINRIFIIDDDEEFRSTLEDTVQESNFKAFPQNERVENFDKYLMDFVHQDDAIVSDHQLKKKNYFPVNGAEVVYKCYERGIPSVLVTRYETHIGEIRKFRKNIPVILNPEDFEPATLVKSLEICIEEFNGEIKPQRKLWRTLVRIDSIDKNHIYIVIPGWDRNEIISLNIEDLPTDVKANIQPDLRLHAKANIGTESPNDLFFIDWELK